MAQTLTVCRAGSEWAFRDVTGALYGQSPDIHLVIEAAQTLATRNGSQVVFSSEAQDQLATPPPLVVDTIEAPPRQSRSRFGGFWSRLARARRRR